ncbi:Multiple organellar RNA editing factor 2-chloroplastic [Striga hermonthica]|uniref:Multiple organellar RNA editing factor 2-chloroplastic n=1 Tax=Striga hermonthica TaxID=68872 RepID=A0A9N7NMW6_STRHE|nr:Multiple organellar RNA editing factor 2-chloroplastic [Striga hermonthica]
MAATISRSILTFRSPGAAISLLQKRLFSSTVTNPPPLPGFRHPISAIRYATPALSHSLRAISPVRVNPVRCRVGGRSGPYSPLNPGSNFNDRPPTEMAPLFPGCDYEHWLIVMDKPGGEGATKQQMIDCYIQTLAKVVGSEEEAKKKIYNVSCDRYFGFGCELDEDTSNKLEGLPGVLFVLPDSYVDAEYKDYGAELFVNGEIVQRSPERQRRVEPVPQRAQDRPRPKSVTQRDRLAAVAVGKCHEDRPFSCLSTMGDYTPIRSIEPPWT